MKKTYYEKKEQFRQEAISFSNRTDIFKEYKGRDISYSELAFWAEYFYKQGKRYGLLKEFKENGIL